MRLARVLCRRTVAAYAREPRRVSVVAAAATGDAAMARAIESTIESTIESRFEWCFDDGRACGILPAVPIQPCALVECDVEPTRPGEYIAYGVTGGTGRDAPRFDRVYSLVREAEARPMHLRF